jgi:hypothetical protein
VVVVVVVVGGWLLGGRSHLVVSDFFIFAASPERTTTPGARAPDWTDLVFLRFVTVVACDTYTWLETSQFVSLIKFCFAFAVLFDWARCVVFLMCCLLSSWDVYPSVSSC